MLCSRSASLTISTRTSLEMARMNLRRFSAWRVCSAVSSSRDSLVTPSTSSPISSPNSSVDLVAGDRGVLDHVVQQGGDDGRGVQPVFGQDAGDLDRMGEIGVARGARLRAVHAHGVDVGAVQQGLVRRRVTTGPSRCRSPRHGWMRQPTHGPSL